MTPAVSAPAILQRAFVACDPHLRRAIGRLEPSIRLPVSYHFGWSDKQGTELTGGSGKGIRSALALLSAEAANGEAIAAIPGAVAVELVHNFSLLHDDIIDADTERRHRTTVWAHFGVGQAIIAGDALLSLAHEVLLESPGEASRVAAMRLASATSAMIAGQALDMAAEGGAVYSLSACEKMEAAKTGALLGAAASIGAVLSGAGADLVNALETFGMEMGLAFQAVDDVFGIWGDPEVTGKPAWSDLRQAKASLPISAALSLGGVGVTELMDLLNQPERDDSELARAAKLVSDLGGRKYADAFASQHSAAAVNALDKVDLPYETKAELLGLATFVVGRAF